MQPGRLWGTGKSLACHRENRHGAFCFGHAAHAFRTWGVLNSSWGVLPPLMEVRQQLNEVAVNAAEGGYRGIRLPPLGNPFTPTGKSIYPHRRIPLGSKAGIAQVCDGWSHR